MTLQAQRFASHKVLAMDWVPVVFLTFKLAVFGTCMFFAIKWHYDQGRKKKEAAERSMVAGHGSGVGPGGPGR